MPGGFLQLLGVTVCVPPGRAALAGPQSHTHPPSWTAAVGCGEEQGVQELLQCEVGIWSRQYLSGLIHH